MQFEGSDPCPTAAGTYKNSVNIDDFFRLCYAAQTPPLCQQSPVYIAIIEGRVCPVQGRGATR